MLPATSVFWGATVFLAVPGSIVAFYCYITVIQVLGADNALRRGIVPGCRSFGLHLAGGIRVDDAGYAGRPAGHIGKLCVVSSRQASERQRNQRSRATDLTLLLWAHFVVQDSSHPFAPISFGAIFKNTPSAANNNAVLAIIATG